MLAGSDPLSILKVLCDCTQDDLLHNLARHRGQADRPVVASVLLVALLVDLCDIGQLPVIWDLPRELGLLIDDEEQLGKPFFQLPHHPTIDPVWSHRLMCCYGSNPLWQPFVDPQSDSSTNILIVRPTNPTSVPEKEMEQIFLKAILRHMKNKKVIENSQHGFGKKKLCFNNRMVFYDEISGHMDKSGLEIRIKE
ncbi:hypothetical protein WISP_17085 [Willisornis vidua]|uniref:Uncharacterized protein n=1 Tax=Willisornis vidua TaxID=1566151 RepID=A0ABQ9DUY7_9PASS|nr:hypothetical protein WISP_17085 [Willisornis vidua]